MALIRKGHQFYAVMSVPKALADVIGKKQIWRSLGASNKKLALLKYCDIISNDFELRKYIGCNAMAIQEKTTCQHKYSLELVDVDDKECVEANCKFSDKLDYTESLASIVGRAWAKTYLEILYAEGRPEAVGVVDLDLHDILKICLIRGKYDVIKTDCLNFIHNKGFPEPTSGTEAVLFKNFLIGAICALQAYARHVPPNMMSFEIHITDKNFHFDFDSFQIQGEYSILRKGEGQPIFNIAECFNVNNAQQTAKVSSSGMTKTLVDVCKEHLETLRCKEATKTSKLNRIMVLNELLDNKPIGNITYENLIDLINNKLPYISNRRGRDHQLSLFESMREGKDNPSIALSPKTVNEYVKCLKVVLRHALKRGYIREDLSFSLTSKSLNNNKTEITPYTVAQLQAIFDMPLFTKTKVEDRDYRFWFPLISLYTGMRIEEIAQLYVDDIKEKAGIHYFSISTDNDTTGRDKSLKTANAIREIPIHSKLIEIGFLDYVERQKGNQYLFSELERDGRGKKSTKCSKWFGRFFDSVNKTISNPEDQIKKSQVFHSFRHTIATEFNDKEYARSDENNFDMMMGWTTQQNSCSRRYKHPSLEKMAEILEKAITYDGLDLSRLVPKKEDEETVS